jgi:hypothetical protein
MNQSVSKMPPSRQYGYDEGGDSRSAASHKSTQSSRSSVLQRAREYNRRIDDESLRRTKSVERSVTDPVVAQSPRAQSAGRHLGNRAPTRERAMASVNHDSRQHDSARSSTESQQQQQHPSKSNSEGRNSNTPKQQQHQRPEATAPRSSPPKQQQQQQQRRVPREEPQEAVVSPELLVDALSGHEDGLLAIAERLMEHYDAGYDVMGEAIIDAFADVQKLFQHVVEAAHMEGAAFESSRREAEMIELRKQAGNNNLLHDVPSQPAAANGGVSRHDEIIDQDVKDTLTEAIRQGAPLRDANKHMESYQLFEHACQNASSLLPVDSDHRGRLQLSIARAESMSPDRACAILRYAMDDVLRSGLRSGNAPPPDLSKRSDMVLTKPKDFPSINGAVGQAGVVQSSAEALASLVEEMKEVLGAPVYDNTPLQSVAQRFWVALGDAQRSQQKNEDLLEQNLGKLKGEYLMARAVSWCRTEESIGQGCVLLCTTGVVSF